MGVVGGEGDLALEWSASIEAPIQESGGLLERSNEPLG